MIAVNPYVYLLIDGADYRWSLQRIPEADMTRLSDFVKENPHAGKKIRAAVEQGKVRGRVRVLSARAAGRETRKERGARKAMGARKEREPRPLAQAILEDKECPLCGEPAEFFGDGSYFIRHQARCFLFSEVRPNDRLPPTTKRRLKAVS